ncbi:hypothetical protein [Rhodococcus sp. 21391]|uniref:hypothetical protein n=1 Tax=Rhodococcus sp. 21391 TaxID=2683591 RepID=UPI00192AF40B|nr:hypothetical protein [Rhodococcus sp. 21391]QQZ19684.1 hypothetical protein GO592_42810 [Rhodococcus sp. 21391]
MRFTDQCSHALLSALLVFRLHPNGFTNKDLRTLTGELRGLDPDTVSTGQMTYDLRRLKTRNLITRIEHTHRYQVTDLELDTAKFLTCVHDRVLRTGLANSPPPQQLPDACEQLPPRTAPPSIPSPPQRNSQPETSSTQT